jgi:hypothetical protein
MECVADLESAAQLTDLGRGHCPVIRCHRSVMSVAQAILREQFGNAQIQRRTSSQLVVMSVAGCFTITRPSVSVQEGTRGSNQFSQVVPPKDSNSAFTLPSIASTRREAICLRRKHHSPRADHE